VKEFAMFPTAIRTATAALVLAAVAACGSPDPSKSLAAAKSHLANNDVQAAVIELKNALQAKPDLPEARFLLGKTLLEREDPVGAAVELQKAADLRVPADDVVPLLARALLQSGQARKVVELDQTNTLTKPESIAALKTSAAIAYAIERQRERSEQALAAALAAGPEHAPALLLRARELAGKRDLDGALRLVDGVIARNAQDADALLLKGELQWARGEQEPAMQTFRQAVAAQPANVEAHGALIGRHFAKRDLDAAKTQLAELQKARPRHPRTAYFEARLAVQTGDLKAAVESTERLLKMTPDSPQVLELAGTVAMLSNEPLRAEAHFGKLVQVAPGLAAARQQLARVYLRTNEPDKALETLAPVLEAAQPDAETLSIAGRAHFQRGDIRQAEQLLARAAKLRPDDVRDRTALAAARLSRGDAAELGELESIAASDDAATADYLLISANMNRRDFDGALKAIARLERKLAGKPQPLQLRGQVLAAKGDLPGARAAFEKALAAQTGFFPAVQALAQLDLREKKPDQARARFEALLKAEPKNARAMLALAGFDEREGKPKEAVAERIAQAVSAEPTLVALRVRQVVYLLGKQDAKAALVAAQAAASAFPDDSQLALLVGRAHMAAGETQQALSALNRAATLAPKAAAPHLAISMFHGQAKNNDAALQSVNRALELEPDNLEALRRAVALNVASEKFDAAYAIAKSVQKRRPTSRVGFELAGDIDMRRKEWSAAAAAYQAALKLQPTTAGAMRLYAAKEAAGDRRGADAAAAAWLKDHARDAGYLVFLGSAAARTGDHAAAEMRYRQAVAAQPENAVALNNLAWSLMQQKKPGGLELAEKANTLAPNQPAFLDTLAMALAAAGKSTEAVGLQRRAVSLQPDAHDLRLNLARFLIESGDKAGARAELDTLARLGSGYAQQSQVKELLSKL
jgi:putative PEP-CTERM system TPR-repeat lipoprotein